jgi:hypothetical protein
VFGRWKWPGWATLGLGLIRAFHLGEDADFALAVLRSFGGGLGVVAAVVASPFFALAMVGYGVLHLLFVGEPKKAVRHYAWTYIGWAIFLICFTTIVVTLGYGAIEIYVKQEVGKRDEEIQKNAAVRPIFWHLTDFQKTSLAFALERVPEDQRFEVKVMCLPDAGSRTYVEDLGKVFLDKKSLLSG